MSETETPIMGATTVSAVNAVQSVAAQSAFTPPPPANREFDVSNNCEHTICGCCTTVVLTLTPEEVLVPAPVC